MLNAGELRRKALAQAHRACPRHVHVYPRRVMRARAQQVDRARGDRAGCEHNRSVGEALALAAELACHVAAVSGRVAPNGDVLEPEHVGRLA